MYQIVSPLLIAMRRGRVSGLGNGYSRITMVRGSIAPILLAPNSSNTGTPFEVITMP